MWPNFFTASVTVLVPNARSNTPKVPSVFSVIIHGRSLRCWLALLGSCNKSEPPNTTAMISNKISGIFMRRYRGLQCPVSRVGHLNLRWIRCVSLSLAPMAWHETPRLSLQYSTWVDHSPHRLRQQFVPYQSRPLQPSSLSDGLSHHH